MTLPSERRTVQNPFIRYAQEAGWTYLPPEEALRLRGGEESAVLRAVLVAQLQRLNPGVVDSVAKAEEVIARLLRVRPDIEGNLEAWEYLKGLKTVFVEAERREKNLRLLDLAHRENNAFHVTDEFIFSNGRFRIRADVVLLVNGIPVIVVETKAASRLEGIAEALDQVRRYHAEAPELMAQAQLFTLTHLIQFFYGPTWNPSRKALFNWKDEQAGDFETLVKTFLAPRRVLRVLSDYILFVRKDGELSKAVLRPHQMRATEKVLARLQDPQKRRGLIWHTQGSGKTYTMITVAKALLEDSRFQNPTVLMIVDRNELQQQLFQNLQATGLGHARVAEKKEHLQQLLRQDTRGLIVSMIHKFDDADANLNTRANIFVLIDEAHRSTGGDLGNYLMGALPNATFIGFTGTPIDKTSHGKGTFKVFGGGDPGGYLDKYSIRESIEDGTTVPLHYQMAPNDLIVDRETMEREFWAAAELEGVADVEELNRVLDRAVTLRNMLKNPERVARIAAFVADHFRRVVQPMGYKAFLVAVDREACGLYKEALDRHLPPEWSRVVISRGHNDPPALKRYHLSDEEEAAVRKAFRKADEPPYLLIVTEKLLTGYDAPILYAMYLDKPMRDHVLLQAIARVNRPYEDDSGRRKTNGLILDFVGIFDNLERALAFDSQDVEGVIEGLEVLQEHFDRLMTRARAEFLPIAQGPTADKAAESALLHFRDKEVREAFYRFFRELEETYEILSPDPFLRPYLEDYQRLVELYRLLRSAYEPGVPVDKSFLRKTAEIVQQHTATRTLREPSATYEIGAAALLALIREEKPETVKVFNLLRELHRLMEEQGRQQPYLIPIGERAEAIRQAFEARQLNSQQALAELENLVQGLWEAESQRKESNLSAQAFAVAWWARVQKSMSAEKAECLAAAVEQIFQQFPHWAASSHQERELRQALYKPLIEAGVQEMVAWADEMLTLLRRIAS
ncbi:type I restriction endonuclease subunit R [Thermogemmata fonticola]|uniref:Type I restriction enzyme endonuclease subunit n=1 Tax=Thermogemmata fonticola TaxID=2755323 RepID=A0A7V8VAY1_9BACT|nr:HsdR family type I site-specific deoxyribonuclease [Thermogemmata fonticola]MBA2224699.1 HsdR family type I site-specific deoxyribonuclease [Thermogemmata fonticola]